MSEGPVSFRGGGGGGLSITELESQQYNVCVYMCAYVLPHCVPISIALTHTEYENVPTNQRTQTHTHTHKHTYSHTTHTHKHMHTHKQTYTQTQTHIRILMHTHTHAPYAHTDLELSASVVRCCVDGPVKCSRRPKAP